VRLLVRPADIWISDWLGCFAVFAKAPESLYFNSNIVTAFPSATRYYHFSVQKKEVAFPPKPWYLHIPGTCCNIISNYITAASIHIFHYSINYSKLGSEILFSFYHDATAPSESRPPHCRGFMITLGRTPLDE
jgi:hypothetical protein